MSGLLSAQSHCTFGSERLFRLHWSWQVRLLSRNGAMQEGVHTSGGGFVKAVDFVKLVVRKVESKPEGRNAFESPVIKHTRHWRRCPNLRQWLGVETVNRLRNASSGCVTFFLLPSSFFLLPSSFFLLPSSFFLLPSSCFLLLASCFFLLPSSFFLLPSSFSNQTAFLSRDVQPKQLRPYLCLLCDADTLIQSVHPPFLNTVFLFWQETVGDQQFIMAFPNRFWTTTQNATS